MELTEANLQLLDRHPLFRGLKIETRRSLLNEARLKDYPRGHGLFLQGDPAQSFFFIASGWIKLFRVTPGGDEVVLRVLARGESFADAAIFDSGVYPVSAEVVEDARLMVIPAASFLRRLKEEPELAFKMLASLSSHMRFLVRQLEQIKGRTASQRVADFLLQLCEAESGESRIRLPYDKLLIAARLGIRPETFSRALSDLRHVGIQVQGREVVVPDVNRLASLVKNV
ncbi:MAG TPA: Crp/Fnr family transcriptional regulator [Alphaproteobacteria bacterium]|nr:Crp/Fnr family transcriptional regulator [Alphaproteobacteria bacterium]